MSWPPRNKIAWYLSVLGIIGLAIIFIVIVSVAREIPPPLRP